MSRPSFDVYAELPQKDGWYWVIKDKESPYHESVARVQGEFAWVMFETPNRRTVKECGGAGWTFYTMSPLCIRQRRSRREVAKAGA